MLSKYVTSLRRLVEEFSEITFTELNISHSENESLRLREKQHNARLNMAINPKKIDFNRAHMWLNNIFFCVFNYLLKSKYFHFGFPV